MGLMDKIRHELIDIIEWLDDSRDTMVWRFPRWENEIKNGAKLIVREGQVAAFVNQGRLGDIFWPGTYALETANLPILSTLMGWKYGFSSPFKAEVYFLATRIFTDRKWGTKNPIMLRDAEFGPVRLRAFGSFAFKIADPAAFLKQVVGTGARFSVEQIGDQIRDMLVARFVDVLGESKIPILDLASNQDELASFVMGRIQSDFATFGLALTTLLVENISLPPQVEEALDKRTSMGVIGNLQAFTQYQAANAMEAVAKQPGGLAAGGVGMGMGYVMANQLGQQMTASQSAPAAAAQPAAASPTAPPPIPQPVAFYLAVQGKHQGPFEVKALEEKATAGQLTREMLVWRSGMSQWTAAGQVPELAAIFVNVPPPIPK